MMNKASQTPEDPPTTSRGLGFEVTADGVKVWEYASWPPPPPTTEPAPDTEKRDAVDDNASGPAS